MLSSEAQTRLPTESVTGPPVPSDSGHAIKRVVEKVGEIAVLPQVVFKIVEMTGSDDTSSRQMEGVIIVDPGFSAKILTQANSVFYGLPRKVTSIREAITFIGARSVRQLAMTVGVFDLFVGKNDSESLRRRAWWRHCIDSAVGSRWVAEKHTDVQVEEAYTCGLLHYIGKTVLDRFAPGEYQRVVEALEEGVSDREAERLVYGCDHIEVGQAVAKHWGFPDVLCDGLNYADCPEPDDTNGNLRACVAVGSRIAQIAIEGRAAYENMGTSMLPAWAMQRLKVSEQDSVTIVENGIVKISEAAKLSM